MVINTIGSPSLNSDAGKIDQRLKIIIVDDREGWEMVSRLLDGDKRLSLHWAGGGDQLMEMLGHEEFDCVIVECIAGIESGFAINERMRAQYPIVPPVVMLTKLGGEVTAIQAFRHGFSDYLDKNSVSSDSITAAILRAVHAKRLEQDRLDTIARLSALAMHDEVTGLGNRSFLDNRLAIMLESAKRHHHRVAMLLIDMNYFQFVNDNYGHGIGDRLLCKFSDKLKQTARRDDTFGRYGAGDFLYLIDRDVSAESVSVTCRRLAGALSFTVEFEKVGFHLSASIGASIYPDDGDDAETLVKAAAMATSRAKASGGGFTLASTGSAWRQDHQINGTAGLSAPLQSNGARISAPAGAPHLPNSPGAGNRPDTTGARYEPVAEGGLAELPDGAAGDKLDCGTLARSPGFVGRKVNRRSEPRHRVFKRGRIVTKNGLSTIECVVRDMSEGGARIATEGAFGLPEQFYFQIIGSQSRILAEKRWQNNNCTGLKFLAGKIAR